MKPVRARKDTVREARVLPMPIVRRLRKHMRKLDRSTRNTTTFQNLRDELLIEIGLRLGLRREELHWLDCRDFEGDTLTVIGKGDRKRYIPIPEDIARLVKKYLRAKKMHGEGVDDLECECGGVEGCPVCGGSGVDRAPLFGSRKGNRLGIRTINDIVAKRAKEAGIGHITPHQFRHTFAADYLERSENPVVGVNDLQRLLGHANEGTTHIYLRRSMADMKGVMEGRGY